MLPDMKKSEEPHYLVVKLKNPDAGLVAKVHCSCKAGSGAHCNHVFALLYQLNDYNCLGYKDFPSDVTCTSQPQSRHIPRATSICSLPVMATHFAWAESDKDGERKRDPVRCKLYDDGVKVFIKDLSTFLHMWNFCQGKTSHLHLLIY